MPEARTLVCDAGRFAFLAREELSESKVRLELAGEPKRGWSNYINLLTELPVRRVRRRAGRSSDRAAGVDVTPDDVVAQGAGAAHRV